MNTVIIDVREPDEFAGGHVEGALNVPLGRIESSPEIAGLAKSTPLIIYCRTGARAGMAKALLEQQGFTNVTNGIDQAQTEQMIHRS